jgi:hypothetical protein
VFGATFLKGCNEVLKGCNEVFGATFLKGCKKNKMCHENKVK